MLPLRDCGALNPAATYTDRWFGLADVTPDQAALSEVVTPMLRGHERVLHVGIGASELARRWSGRVSQIDGITVMQGELDASPALPNYRVWWRNKYASGGWPDNYDVIVDNNPGSFACCRKHSSEWLDSAAGMLAPGGMFVTHARGCTYRKPGGVAMGWLAWWWAGKRRGMRVERFTADVWIWRRGT
ncbi:hypothetical protein LBMAG42_19750 [Deltaproteobacteria bacterium]|nr:hypothetical protein LBMAG42_19750 [Deltaproteobacteria bacterium]